MKIDEIIEKIRKGHEFFVSLPGLGDVYIAYRRGKFRLHYIFLVPFPKKEYTFYLEEHEFREWLSRKLTEAASVQFL